MKKIILAVILLSFPLLCFAKNTPTTTSTQENNKEQIYIPKNLDECFSELKKIIKKEDLEAFKNKKEDAAISNAHLGIGMWIRNNWGLWAKSQLAKYFNGLGVYHPDDMSSIILISFHRFLNNKDIGLERQIKYYQDYWEDQKRMDIILKVLKKSSFDLDVSGFGIFKDNAPLDKNNIEKYLRHGISHPACNDCYDYTVILEQGSGKFWIHKTGGFAGVDILYGPGVVDKSGKIERKGD